MPPYRSRPWGTLCAMTLPGRCLAIWLCGFAAVPAYAADSGVAVLLVDFVRGANWGKLCAPGGSGGHLGEARGEESVGRRPGEPADCPGSGAARRGPDARERDGGAARPADPRGRLAVRAGRRDDRRGGPGRYGRRLDGREPAAHLERERRGQHERHRSLQEGARLVPARVRRAGARRPSLAAVRRREHGGRRVAERQEARPAQGGVHGLPLRRDGHPQAHRKRARGEDGQQRAQGRGGPHGHRSAARRLQPVRGALPEGRARLDTFRRAHRARRPRRPGRVRTHDLDRGPRHGERPREAGQRRTRGRDVCGPCRAG